MIIFVVSPHHKEKRSFIWSDTLPVDLAAREAAKEYGYKDIDKYKWSFTRSGSVLSLNSILKDVLFTGDYVDLVTLVETTNVTA